jgi:hypothetical protein
MFKPGSGRKVECEVWKYFKYDKSTDRSKCEVLVKIGSTADGASDSSEMCGQWLTGKNATNLRNHLKSKHKEIHAVLKTAEKQNQKRRQFHRYRDLKVFDRNFSHDGHNR